MRITVRDGLTPLTVSLHAEGPLRCLRCHLDRDLGIKTAGPNHARASAGQTAKPIRAGPDSYVTGHLALGPKPPAERADSPYLRFVTPPLSSTHFQTAPRVPD